MFVKDLNENNKNSLHPMLLLDPWSFDQTQKGWRSLPVDKSIKIIKEYLQLYVKNDLFVNAPKGTKTIGTEVLYWHLGQLFAIIGDNKQAVQYMQKCFTDKDWNDYVRATIAFLTNNEKEFSKYVGKPNSNKEVIDRLAVGWGKPYKDVY